MSDYFLKLELENDRFVEGRLTRIQNKAPRILKDIIDDSTDFAYGHLKFTVPKESGYTLRHVDKTSPRYFPGGVGGGGLFQATVGIKSGESMHPLYNYRGTGINVGRPSILGRTEVLRSPTGRNVMRLSDSKRGVRYKYRTRGQKSNDYLARTAEATRLFIEVRTIQFGRELLL